MTKAELKEKHPELYAAIEADAKAGMVDQAQLDALEKDNAQLKNDQRDLITANIEMSETLAKNIFDASFAASDIPKALKPKLSKVVDHKAFVDEKGVLASEKYKDAVDAELAEWSAAAEFGKKEPEIKGLSTENKAEETGIAPDEDKDDDAVAARMLKHIK